MKHGIRLILARCLSWVLCTLSSRHALPAEPVLILAPHADDETLGCGGLITQLNRQGIPCTVGYLTNSSGNHQDLQRRQQQMEIRRKEALAALRVLGHSPEHVVWFNLPDGQLDHISALQTLEFSQAFKKLLSDSATAHLYLPFQGSHSSEHEAAYHLIIQALEAAEWTGTLWEYPIWAWWNPFRFARLACGKNTPTCLPLGDDLKLKQKALLAHASQLLPQSKLPPILARLCLHHWEFFFPLTIGQHREQENHI